MTTPYVRLPPDGNDHYVNMCICIYVYIYTHTYTYVLQRGRAGPSQVRISEGDFFRVPSPRHCAPLWLWPSGQALARASSNPFAKQRLGGTSLECHPLGTAPRSGFGHLAKLWRGRLQTLSLSSDSGGLPSYCLRDPYTASFLLPP